jgi:DNA-binding YbaB/EbfC family protein
MDIKAIMEQAGRMKTDMEKVQKEFETKEFEGSSGGGMVKVKINGKGKILNIFIDPSLITKVGDADEIQIISDLVMAAHNQAKQNHDEESSSSFSGLAGAADLPAWLK